MLNVKAEPQSLHFLAGKAAESPSSPSFFLFSCAKIEKGGRDCDRKDEGSTNENMKKEREAEMSKKVTMNVCEEREKTKKEREKIQRENSLRACEERAKSKNWTDGPGNLILEREKMCIAFLHIFDAHARRERKKKN